MLHKTYATPLGRSLLLWSFCFIQRGAKSMRNNNNKSPPRIMMNLFLACTSCSNAANSEFRMQQSMQCVLPPQCWPQKTQRTESEIAKYPNKINHTALFLLCNFLWNRKDSSDRWCDGWRRLGFVHFIICHAKTSPHIRCACRASARYTCTHTHTSREAELHICTTICCMLHVQCVVLLFPVLLKFSANIGGFSSNDQGPGVANRSILRYSQKHAHFNAINTVEANIQMLLMSCIKSQAVTVCCVWRRYV